MTNYYIAGVKDVEIQTKRTVSELFETFDQYVNAGVLLMNLKLIRDDGLMEKFMSEAKRQDVFYDFQDQDILNKTCYGRIKFLDLKFNLFPCIHIAAERDVGKCEKFEGFFSKKQFCEACNDPAIVHFASRKPWHEISTRFAIEWWEYSRKSPFYEMMLHEYIARKICKNFPGKYGKFTYYRCKILSKITFGDKKIHYEKKCRRIEKINRL
jgi:lipopolysaccharide biosynthesis glycosyltransferase